MPRRNPAVREPVGCCPLCERQLSSTPVEVGAAFVRFEVRCYGPHDEEDLKRARGSIFGTWEPGG